MLDSPLESPDTSVEVQSCNAISRQYSRDATTSTVSIQGSGNHYHACASDDYDDVGFDPSILPPPDPWIDSVTDDPLDVCVSSSTILEVCEPHHPPGMFSSYKHSFPITLFSLNSSNQLQQCDSSHLVQVSCHSQSQVKSVVNCLSEDSRESISTCVIVEPKCNTLY